MSIIYEKTPNGLYATGQRTVSTFPSGLIRVDQTFTGKTSAAATHRATLAVGADFPGGSYPAMDGLKIFPAPQEKRRDDGFTEFLVSGFGRLNSTGNQKTEFKVSTFQNKKYKSDRVTLLKVRKKSESLSIPDFDSNPGFLPGQINTYEFVNSSLSFTPAGDGPSGISSSGKLLVVVVADVQTPISDSGSLKWIAGILTKCLLTSYQAADYGDFIEETMIFDAPESINGAVLATGPITVTAL
jgi:hypothetical protein